MEKRDAELEHAKLQCQKFVTENNNLKLEIERLTNETEDLHKISMYCINFKISMHFLNFA